MDPFIQKIKEYGLTPYNWNSNEEVTHIRYSVGGRPLSPGYMKHFVNGQLHIVMDDAYTANQLFNIPVDFYGLPVAFLKFFRVIVKPGAISITNRYNDDDKLKIIREMIKTEEPSFQGIVKEFKLKNLFTNGFSVDEVTNFLLSKFNDNYYAICFSIENTKAHDELLVEFQNAYQAYEKDVS